MTGNDVTWLEVTGSDQEVTSFDRKSPGSGGRRVINQVLGMFELLQGCNSQEMAVTSQEGHHVTGTNPEVTSFDPKSPGGGCRRPICNFWAHLSSYRAVTLRRWQSRDRKQCHVGESDRK